MRVCILSNALSIHTQRWAREFARRGHEVYVLSIRSNHIPGVTVQTVRVGPENSKSVFWTFLSYLRLLLTCRRKLNKILPDILQAHYAVTHGVIGAFSGFHPLMISVWGKDVIWDGSGRMPWYKRKTLRYAFARADLIGSTSTFMKKEIEYLVPKNKQVEVTPFGIECDKFAPVGQSAQDKSESQCRIGFIKTLSKKYGPRYLIGAMPKVLKEIPCAQLVIAGCGPMEAELKALTRELGIEENVEFAGFIPHKEVPVLMRTFDILVNSSIHDSESFGVVVLEASASGIPVVATHVGGVPEVCIDGQTGILVEPGNIDAIAEAILTLARSPELRQKMGKLGRQFVLNHYEWKSNADTMMALLKRLHSL